MILYFDTNVFGYLLEGSQTDERRLLAWKQNGAHSIVLSVLNFARGNGQPKQEILTCFRRLVRTVPVPQTVPIVRIYLAPPPSPSVFALIGESAEKCACAGVCARTWTQTSKDRLLEAFGQLAATGDELDSVGARWPVARLCDA